MGNLYLGLLHFPMRNRCGEIVATALTSMDVHDIARSARTYGVARYFVITPLPTQRDIAWRIRGFWTEGERAAEKSRRGEALEIVWVATDLEETLDWISEAEGESPFLVATSARSQGRGHLSYEALRERLAHDKRPVYILFGTGWGMTEELIETCDAILPPIMAESDFNHLSVRAAAAIVLDRVRGES
jgi:hypothetical protein